MTEPHRPYSFLTVSGSCRIPSASSLRLASSSAQVWMLLILLAIISDHIISHPTPQSVSHLIFNSPLHHQFILTYLVSGLKAYATTPNAHAPPNPQNIAPYHPSFSYCSQGLTPNSHPVGGSYCTRFTCEDEKVRRAAIAAVGATAAGC